MSFASARQLGEFPNSTFLCDFDGTNGSTTFVDQYGHTMTASGTVALSTSHPKFGTASLQCQGSGFARVTKTTGNDLSLIADFTVEGWLWFDASPPSQVMLSKRTGTSSNSWLLIDFFGALFMYVNKSGALTQINSSGISVSTGAWHHLAIVRLGSVVTAFFDGVSQGTVTGVTGPIADDGSDMVIGAGGTDGSFPMTGFWDQMRVSQVARYTSDFTPGQVFS